MTSAGRRNASFALAALAASTAVFAHEAGAQTVINPTPQSGPNLPDSATPAPEPAFVAPLAPSSQLPTAEEGETESFEITIVPLWAGRAPDRAPPDAWKQAFPVLIGSGRPGGQRSAVPCVPGKLLDDKWILSCLGGEDYVPGSGRVVRSRAGLAGSINAINRTFYENGYVDSGIKVTEETRGPPGTPVRLTLTLVIGTLAECDPRRRKGSRIERYALARLTHGCRPDRPFNAYILERNFRSLAGGEVIERVSVRLEPDPEAPDKPGVAYLGSVDENTPLAVAKSPFRLWGTTANDRASSVGSIRSSIGGQWRTPLPFLSIRGEVGVTDGVTDYAGDVFVELSPNLRASFSGDHSNAAIVDPALRVLDIRSETTGFSGTIIYGVLRCPLTPQFASYPLPDRRDPSWSSAFRTSDPGGLLTCPLPVRLADDVPTRWKPLREISLSATLSTRVTDTSLLGIPFSFAPGALNGRSKVTVLRGSVDWLEAGRYGSSGERGWTIAARATVSHGLAGTRVVVPGILSPSPRFTSVNLQWNGAVQLPAARLVLNVSGGAQWADGPLYTSERVPIGGTGSVRGYELGTLLADQAAYGSANLYRDFTLTGGRRLPGTADFDPGRFRLGVFADVGFGRDLTVPGRWQHISSIGLTAAWRPSRALSAEISWAHRLDRRVFPDRDWLLKNGLSFRLEFRPLELF